MQDKRIENCLKDYEKINDKITDRYDLRLSDLETILKLGQEKNQGKSFFNLAWYLISISFKVGFVLGRRSIKNSQKQKVYY